MIKRYLFISVIILFLLCTTASAGYTTIDFTTGGGTDKWFYEKGNEGSNPPGSGPDITVENPILNYGGIDESDGAKQKIEITKNYYATHHFKFTVNSTDLVNFIAHWEGYGSQYSSDLYIWNFTNSSWDFIGMDTNIEGDNTIEKTFTSDLNNYINASGHLHLVATSYRDAGAKKYFHTNYVKIDAYYSSSPSMEKPRTYNSTIEKPYFKNEDVIIRVNATSGGANLTNATITIKNAAGSTMVDKAEMSVETGIPNGDITYIYTYTPPGDATGNGWRVSVEVNDDAAFTVFNKTIFHISTRPGYSWKGFPLETTKSGTVNGGVYIYGRNYFGDSENRNVTENLEVPNGTIQWAHFYYGIWGGNPCAAGWINLTWTNASGQTKFTNFIGPYDTFECQGLEKTIGEDPAQDTHAGSNDHHEYNWGSTCGKWTGYFDVTDIVTSGVNIANTNTENGFIAPCDDLDARQYGGTLVVVYEGGDNPKEIDYWINEGTMGFNYQTGGINCIGDTPGYDNDFIYFPGTITGDFSRAEYTGLWLTANPDKSQILKFNDQEVLNASENNISDMTVYPYFLHTWDVTDKLTASGNNAWFDRGDNPWVAWSFSALVVEKTGSGVPNVAVTVNNVSFSTVVAGSTNEIPISLTLNNTGNASASIKAVFTTSNGTVYGLNGTSPNIIPGNNFKLGPNGNEKFLTSTTIETSICTLGAGQTLHYDAILIVPPGQTADDYLGTIQLSW